MVRTAFSLAQVISPAGLAPTFGAPNVDGNSFDNTRAGYRYLEVKNTGGSAMTVTVETPKTIGGLALADLVVSVPATTGVRKIGPFPGSLYNQPDGHVWVNYSTVTSVTVGLFEITQTL